VFILPMIGLTGTSAIIGVQVGYSIADVLAKAAFGLFIYNIALKKTHSEEAALQPKQRDAIASL
jgi:hypothetical protein